MSVVSDSPSLDIDIALATDVDRNDVVRLLCAQFSEHDIHLEQGRVDLAVDGLLRDPSRGRILVARRGAQIIGLAAMSYIWTLEHGGKSCWLDELFVNPDFRERHVGTKLLHAAYAQAQQDECIAMDLEVEATHARAANLYRREGFSQHSRTRFVRMLP